MSIQDWGAVGEVIGGLAVLVTLLYLAKDSALYESYRASLTNPDGISREQRDRGWLILDAYMSLMESYYLHNREYGEVLSEERWTRMLSRMLNLPGGSRYWEARRVAFQAEFAAYVDGMINEHAPVGS